MKKLMPVIIIVSLFALGEVVVRAHSADKGRLEEILGILEEDPKLFWRLRPGLNTTFQDVEISINSKGFRGHEFSLNRAENTIRIFCLGASPTFGWGVPFEKTYSRELESMLEEKFSGKHFEVINAGVIGYSSFQGLVLLETQILKYAPSLITVSYCINDVDKHRFYRSDGRADKELPPVNPAVIALRNIFESSSLYRMLEKTVHRFSRFRQTVSGQRRDLSLGKSRVSLKDYAANLINILKIARANNVKVLFIKMPLNLPLPPKISPSSLRKFNRLFSKGLNYAGTESYDAAISQFEKAIEVSPYSAEAYYYLGVCYENKGDYARAEAAFKKAKDYDAFRCRIDSESYNQTMEKVAIAEGVPLVDIVSAFAQLKDERLFIHPVYDPIHPSVLGHRIIAREIYKQIIEKNLGKSNGEGRI